MTNRRGLDGGLPQLREAIQRAACAGVDWIQIREKDLDARALVELTRAAISYAGGSGTRVNVRVIVNDRLDVALAAGAAGVHLGESSIPVRSIAEWRGTSGRSNFLVGASCHSLESAVAAARDGADYIFFGPVFSTPSKESFGPPQGIEKLREVCVALPVPVFAIGGITVKNSASVATTGASGIAAIRLFQDSADVGGVVSKLRA